MNTNKKVLIIEDETPLLNILSDKLSSAGYAVVKAQDGKSGLASAISEKPNLILLDITMPIMDGLTMLKYLRQEETIKDTEVVLLTNSSSSNLLVEALTLGAHDYLVKSDWSLDDVVKLVDGKLK